MDGIEAGFSANARKLSRRDQSHLGMIPSEAGPRTARISPPGQQSSCGLVVQNELPFVDRHP